jgi:Skp family chaperone for outer membrane proteins
MNKTVKAWALWGGLALTAFGLAKHFGFVTPGERLANAEKPASHSTAMLQPLPAAIDQELRAEVRAHATDIATLKANVQNLKDTADRSEVKLDRILERLPRRGDRSER